MRLECSYDLEGLGEDANTSIITTNKEGVRTRAYTIQVIALAISVSSRLRWSKPRLTSKIEKLSSSSGKSTSDTSKKLKTFH